MAYTFVDTADLLVKCLDQIEGLPCDPPSLYIDLEGVDLCRHGSIAILQVFALPIKHCFLIDVHVLKRATFDTKNSKGTTLKKILEADNVPKVIFDVRNDSDALYAHYQINLKGIHDLQVMEFARPTYGRARRFVSGLAGCIERDVSLSYTERQKFENVKRAGQNLFAPEKGGAYEIFLARPISTPILDYCIQDVQCLPKLWETYWKQLGSSKRKEILEEGVYRVWSSQQADYQPKGRDKAIGPWQVGRPPRFYQYLTQLSKSQTSPAATPEVKSIQVLQTPVTASVTQAAVRQQNTGVVTNIPTDAKGGIVSVVEVEDDLSTNLDRLAISRQRATLPQTTGVSVEEGDWTEDYDNDFSWTDVGDNEGGVEALDFTACDKECGYCGRCDY